MELTRDWPGMGGIKPEPPDYGIPPHLPAFRVTGRIKVEGELWADEWGYCERIKETIPVTWIVLAWSPSAAAQEVLDDAGWRWCDVKDVDWDSPSTVFKWESEPVVTCIQRPDLIVMAKEAHHDESTR
jgi:hypothetical protein